MSSEFQLLTVFVFGYLLGSFPTAYVVLRLSYEMDIREVGSTNVGAMNAFEVTGSRVTGIVIGIVDALKGIAAVGLPLVLTPTPTGVLPMASAGLVGAVCGHNYNLWLSLYGGRIEGGKGLATTAGGLLIYMPLLIPAWAVFYLLGLIVARLLTGRPRIIIGNVVATSLFVIPGFLEYGLQGGMVTLLLAAVILPKHMYQVRVLWTELKNR